MSYSREMISDLHILNFCKDLSLVEVTQFRQEVPSLKDNTNKPPILSPNASLENQPLTCLMSSACLVYESERKSMLLRTPQVLITYYQYVVLGKKLTSNDGQFVESKYLLIFISQSRKFNADLRYMQSVQWSGQGGRILDQTNHILSFHLSNLHRSTIKANT